MADKPVDRAELAERLRAALALVASDAPFTDEEPLGETRSSYGDRTCGCSWDSGPYAVHCHKHDPLAHLTAVVEEVIAALDAPPSKGGGQ